MSRRQADKAIAQRRVTINQKTAELGTSVETADIVRVDGAIVGLSGTRTILLNKPAGYVVSRVRQGNNPTVYALLPEDLHHLKPIGRLDKDSRGLLLLSNDGDLIEQLTHPRHQKHKVYYVTLDGALEHTDRDIIQRGVRLDDGLSYLEIAAVDDNATARSDPRSCTHQITMREGRNRQIRRTFAAAGYTVTDLLRVQLGDYVLGNLPEGEYREEV